eukprot:scaffold66354_cov63-Phaeocystis_antarctica.AAC.3
MATCPQPAATCRLASPLGGQLGRGSSSAAMPPLPPLPPCRARSCLALEARPLVTASSRARRASKASSDALSQPRSCASAEGVSAEADLDATEPRPRLAAVALVRACWRIREAQPEGVRAQEPVELALEALRQGAVATPLLDEGGGPVAVGVRESELHALLLLGGTQHQDTSRLPAVRLVYADGCADDRRLRGLQTQDAPLALVGFAVAG